VYVVFVIYSHEQIHRLLFACSLHHGAYADGSRLMRVHKILPKLVGMIGLETIDVVTVIS